MPSYTLEKRRSLIWPISCIMNRRRDRKTLYLKSTTVCIMDEATERRRRREEEGGNWNLPYKFIALKSSSSFDQKGPHNMVLIGIFFLPFLNKDEILFALSENWSLTFFYIRRSRAHRRRLFQETPIGGHFYLNLLFLIQLFKGTFSNNSEKWPAIRFHWISSTKAMLNSI